MEGNGVKMERKLIGRVGVDSGQLMIMDPCYLKSDWRMTGETIGLQFWGGGQEEMAEKLKELGFNPIAHNDVYRIFEQDLEKLVMIQDQVYSLMNDVSSKVVCMQLTNSSYQEVCDITASEKQAGAIGLGVAFSSGFGDGLYDVYATYRDFEYDNNMKDRRIAKVEIILIEDEENSIE